MIDPRAAEILKHWRTVPKSYITYTLYFVYFVQEGSDGPIKIGRAEDPLSRLSELQCGNPRHLRIAHVVVADIDTERKLHEFWRDPKWLKEASVRGEWFGNGHEQDILDMGSRITERQIEAYRAGADIDTVQGQVFTRAMFARSEQTAA